MSESVGNADVVHLADLQDRIFKVALLSKPSLFADALAAALAEHDALELTEVLTDTAAAEAALSSHPVDVVLMDLGVSNEDGPALLRRLLGRHPQLRVVALSVVDNDFRLVDAVAAGASGYVTMDADLDAVVRTITCAAEGQSVPSGRRLTRVVRSVPPDSCHPRNTRLTAREREVLGRIVQGQSTRQMADEMEVTIYTARTHIQNLLNKLGVHSKLEAAAYAAQHGLV